MANDTPPNNIYQNPLDSSPSDLPSSGSDTHKPCTGCAAAAAASSQPLPTSTSDQPSDIERILNSVDAETQSAVNDVKSAIEGMTAGTYANVQTAVNNVGLALDGIIGGVDVALDKPVRDIWKAVDKQYTNSLTSVAQAEGELINTGIQMPFTMAERAADLADDSHSWLVTRLPGLAAYMAGSDPPGDPPPNVGVMAGTQRIGDPGGTGVMPGPPVPFPIPGLPPEPPPPTPVGLPPLVPPVVPPVSPGPPPAPIPAPAPPPGPPGAVCCPAPAITVVVPPVVMPPPTSPVPPAVPPAPPVPPAPSPIPPEPPPSPPEPEPVPPEPVPPEPTPWLWSCIDTSIEALCALPAAPTLFWGAPNACEAASILTANMVPSAGGGGDIADDPSWWQAITYPVRCVAVAAETLASAIGGGTSSVEEIRAEVNRTFSRSAVGAAAGDLVFKQLAGVGLDNYAAAVTLGTELALAGVAEANSHMPITYLMQSKQYLFQYANPQYIPSQAELNEQYLSNQIDGDTWTCMTRANGNIPTLAARTVQASNTRPNNHELTQLWLRGYVSLDDLGKRMRENGVLNDRVVNEYQALSIQPPGISDITRMMVRDAADDSVASDYNYDKDFDRKFSGPLKEWAKWQGVDANIMKYQWRAHWQIPSNTQLYEMFQRLRPDRPEVITWDSLTDNGNDTTMVEQLGPRPLTVDIDDVKQAIEVNDQAPAWVDKLLAISYRPITNTDAARAHEIGTFNDGQLYQAFRDNGYDDDNAKLLVNFYKQQKSRRIANTTGVWTFRKIVNAYKDGSINRDQARGHLQTLINDPGQIQAILDGADAEMAADVQHGIIVGIRKRFVYGEVDAGTTSVALGRLKLSEAQVEGLVGKWQGEMNGRLKEPTVRMLSKWYMVGVIDVPSFLARLLRLGYNQDDANRIISSAAYDLQRQNYRDARQAAKDQIQFYNTRQAAERAQTKDLESALKQAQQEITRIEKVLNKRAKDAGQPLPYPTVGT